MQNLLCRMAAEMCENNVICFNEKQGSTARLLKDDLIAFDSNTLVKYEAEVFQTRGVQKVIFHHFSRIVCQLSKTELFFTYVVTGF
jgi:hypothetical protein